jgi:hypothetical protein
MFAHQPGSPRVQEGVMAIWRKRMGSGLERGRGHHLVDLTGNRRLAGRPPSSLSSSPDGSAAAAAVVDDQPPLTTPSSIYESHLYNLRSPTTSSSTTPRAAAKKLPMPARTKKKIWVPSSLHGAWKYKIRRGRERRQASTRVYLPQLVSRGGMGTGSWFGEEFWWVRLWAPQGMDGWMDIMCGDDGER